MHRGSSKGPRGQAPRPEPLPLSASPLLRIDLTVARAGRSDRHTVRVPKGTPLRVVLRSIGQAAEGSAVLAGDRPVPLDLPLERNSRFTVIPTFSGG
jgi:sulfur carrier protein ThiS